MPKIPNNLFYSEGVAPTPEEQLWCAVLHKAINDATSLPGLAARAANKGDVLDGTFQIDQQAKRHAVVWLSRTSDDLRTVCKLASYDMEAVLARGEALLRASSYVACHSLQATVE